MTVRETRRVVTVVLVLLVVIDLAALGVLLSPLAKSRQRRTEDLREMQQQKSQGAAWRPKGTPISGQKQ